MRLIDADALKESMGTPKDEIDKKINKVICAFIDNAPTVESTFKEKVIELYNKYDPLLVHIDDRILPVKNTSKQDCYDLVYEIGELIEWRRVLFRKYHPIYFKDDVRGTNND